MSTVWFKILAQIDIVNQVIEAHSATIYIEVKNPYCKFEEF